MGLVCLIIVYLALILNTYRLFVKCTYTEPGVIPRLRSTRLDYTKLHYVKYADNDSSFFSLNKFMATTN